MSSTAAGSRGQAAVYLLLSPRPEDRSAVVDLMHLMHYPRAHQNAPRAAAMPTIKPRITVTLTERQHAVLRSISENSGQSMSAFVSEILEQSLPVLERMAETFRKIKAAQDEQKRRIVSELDQAQTEVEPILSQVLGQFDLFMSRIERATGASETGAASPAATGAGPTPVTNRGVTPSPDKGRKRPTGAASSPLPARRASSGKSRA